MVEKKKLQKRNEVDKKFTWAMEDLYASDDLWQQEYEKIKEMLPRALEYQGRLSKSAELLYGFLQLSDEISKRLERVYVYAGQK
ncbi:MAG TPA: oligoendopeptidase F, partial [Lachnospiraceae bacterium]|nr:oligoendopeptidase F [Lachnospiraceae bacterium]